MKVEAGPVPTDSAAGASPAYWSSERGDAEVDFLLQGAEAVYPVEAKAERNLKENSRARASAENKVN